MATTVVLSKGRLTRRKGSVANRRTQLKPVIKTVSITDVLAAGGATKFALTKGVDPKKARISGFVRISRTETDRLQEELRKQA